jgi:uncharacterized RDD family membrane protein YckC
MTAHLIRKAPRVTQYSASAIPVVPYSDWPHRAGSLLIDQVPIIIIDLIGQFTGHFLFSLFFGLIGLVVQGYNRWYLGGQGQSWGKKALGLKLVSEDTGQPIGMAMAFVRDICHALDSLACFIGWLFPLWDAKRQTFADKIIRTIVIPA